MTHSAHSCSRSVTHGLGPIHGAGARAFAPAAEQQGEQSGHLDMPCCKHTAGYQIAISACDRHHWCCSGCCSMHCGLRMLLQFRADSDAAHTPALLLPVCQALQHPHHMLCNDINVILQQQRLHSTQQHLTLMCKAPRSQIEQLPQQAVLLLAAGYFTHATNDNHQPPLLQISCSCSCSLLWRISPAAPVSPIHWFEGCLVLGAGRVCLLPQPATSTGRRM